MPYSPSCVHCLLLSPSMAETRATRSERVVCLAASLLLGTKGYSLVQVQDNSFWAYPTSHEVLSSSCFSSPSGRNHGTLKWMYCVKKENRRGLSPLDPSLNHPAQVLEQQSNACLWQNGVYFSSPLNTGRTCPQSPSDLVLNSFSFFKNTSPWDKGINMSMSPRGALAHWGEGFQRSAYL